MSYFITSDLHFDHKNMCGAGNAFEAGRAHIDTVDEMNEILIKAHNSVVRADDVTYLLGDISLHVKPERVFDLLNQMKGSFIIVKGNHDNSKTMKYLEKHNYALPSGRMKFETHDVGLIIKKDGYVVYLTHQPIMLGGRGKTLNLHGHIHSKPGPRSYMFNIGVDSPEIETSSLGVPMTLDKAMELAIIKKEQGTEDIHD